MLLVGGVRLDTAARFGAGVGTLRLCVVGPDVPPLCDGKAGTSELTAAFRTVGDCAEAVHNAHESAKTIER